VVGIDSICVVFSPWKHRCENFIILILVAMMCRGVLDNWSIYGYVGFILLFDGCLVVEIVAWVLYFYFICCLF